MSARENLRKGWCPSALRPMETGDGILLRLRPRAGAFTISQLRAIAEVAAKHGSGNIDLTNRANLQLRGLSETTYDGAIDALDCAGLISASPDIESVRNIVADPLAGLDASRADIRAIARELEHALALRPELYALPGKFGFEISGTCGPVPGHTSADILITAEQDDRFCVRLDGELQTVAIVSRTDVVSTAVRAAATFVAVASENPLLRRMRDAVQQFGSRELFRMTGLTAELVPLTPSLSNTLPIGVLGPSHSPFAVGVGLPFGRIDAGQLQGLCVAAAASNSADIRPTKQRALIVPVSGAAAHVMLDTAKALGLITDGTDPRLNADVCPGAPACRNATTETRNDAVTLIEALSQRGVPFASIHVSGCEKGCARASSAEFTFVARNGAYDFVRGGRAGDAPQTSSFAPLDMAAAVFAGGAGCAP